jgi:hypothetical protein
VARFDSDVVSANLHTVLTLVREASDKLEGNTFGVYREQDIAAEGARVGFPLAAVLYTGMFAPASGDPVKNQMADIVFDILCVGNAHTALDDGVEVLSVISVLAAVRSSLILYRTPTARPLRFVREAPTDFKGHVAYTQRWSVRVNLL